MRKTLAVLALATGLLFAGVPAASAIKQPPTPQPGPGNGAASCTLGGIGHPSLLCLGDTGPAPCYRQFHRRLRMCIRGPL